MPQIRKWAHKILPRPRQGRDGPLGRDPRARHLRQGAVRLHAHAGLRRQQLDRVISELRLAGYRGSIDIEGWHDPVYRDALEMTGQVRGAELSQGMPGRGRAVPNPS